MFVFMFCARVFDCKFTIYLVLCQVSFADVNSDGKLELLAVDRSGNVICKELVNDGTGTLVGFDVS